jgi:integrase
MSRPRKGGLYKHANGTWMFRVQVEGRRYVKSTGTSNWQKAVKKKREFMELLNRPARDELLASIRHDLTRKERTGRGDWQLGRITLKDAWEKIPYATTQRQQERALKPGSVQDAKIQWKKLVKWMQTRHPGVIYMDDVTKQHAERFRADLVASQLSGNRINKVVDHCRVMFRLAGIKPTPFDGLPRRHHTPIHRKPFTAQELQTIVNNSDGELRRLFLQGMYSGGRLKTVVLRKWGDHVDPDLRSIRAVEAKTEHLDQEIRYAIHPCLRAELESIAPEDRTEYVTPKLAKQYLKSRAMVSNKIGMFLRDTCNIVTRETVNGKRVTVKGFHSLRHSVATQFAEAGVPQAVAEAILGHNNAYVHKIYVHVGNKAVDSAIEQLPAVGNIAATKAARTQDADALRKLVGAMAKEMTAETWEIVKGRLIALASDDPG